MTKDEIAEEIVNILNKFSESHSLGQEEMERLALVVATIVRSEPDIRHMVYIALAEVANQITNILDEKYKKIMKEIDPDKKDVLN
jgi:hypothetical protein